ncbi:MAG: hypothetical protein IT234_00035 [Bacteroidia bacterium]|nr:hypothetical protein [Bacteroidia bacterium]
MRTIKQTIKPVFYIVLILFMILWNINCFGQDSICSFEKTCYYGKVMEISDIEIKYKKAGFLEGPSYVLDKYEISHIKYENGKCDSFPEVKPWFRPAKKVYYDTIKVSAAKPVTANSKSFSLPSVSSSDLSPLKINDLGSNDYLLNKRLYTPKTMCNYLIEHSKDNKIKQLAIQSENNRKLKSIGFLAFPFGIAGLAAAITENDASYFIAGAMAAGVSIGIAASNHNAQKRNLKEAVKLYNQKY